MTMKAGEAARTGAKSRSGGGARNVFILIMVSKILAAAAPPLLLPLLVDVFWMTAGGGFLYNQYSLVHKFHSPQICLLDQALTEDTKLEIGGCGETQGTEHRLGAAVMKTTLKN